VWGIYQTFVGEATMARADAVVVISPQEERALRAAGFRPKRVELIPPGIEPVEFAPRRENPFTLYGLAGRRTLFFAGRITRAKGLDLLFAAFPTILRRVPEAHIAIAGEDFGERDTFQAFAAALGIVAGTLAASRPYSRFDYLLSLTTLFGVSMPVYWLGLMLIILFAVNLNWLPAAGAEGATSIILPSLTLAAFSVALIARMTRSSMLEVLGQDYVRTARAKGLSETFVVARHALRNALIPLITIVGLSLGFQMGGAVVIETIFLVPGVGRILIESIFHRDFTMIQAIIVIVGVAILSINLLVDLLYGWLDPRIRYA
jgi:glycosyltransferase involved in cell wall biosynthesis